MQVADSIIRSGTGIRSVRSHNGRRLRCCEVMRFLSHLPRSGPGTRVQPHVDGNLLGRWCDLGDAGCEEGSSYTYHRRYTNRAFEELRRSVGEGGE